MKIVHVIRQPRLAGAELLVARLCDQHLKAGVTPHIIATHPVDRSAIALVAEVRAKGVQFDVPERYLGRLARLLFLRRSMIAAAPDAVFAHTVLPSWFTRIAGLGLNIPIVTVLHAATKDYQGIVYGSEWLAPAAAMVVGVAEQNIAWYREQFGDRSPLRLIPNGVDLDVFRSLPGLRDQARAALLHGTGKTTIFLHVGRLTSVKRQDISITGFELLPPAIQESSLLLIAGLAEAPEMEAIVVKAAARNSSIRYLGAPSDITGLFAAADAVLVPSDDEAHPAIVIEGLCSQAEVIASDIPAHQFARRYQGVSLIRDGNEMAAAMARVSGVCYERPFDDFDIAQTARNYEAVVRELSH